MQNSMAKTKESKEKKVIPRGKYVLVLQEEPQTRESEFGIITPDSDEQEQKARGVVQEVGSDVKDLKKGDEVIFGAYAGEELITTKDFKEIKYRLLYDDDIIAYLK